jgi:hypothetical protein
MTEQEQQHIASCGVFCHVGDVRTQPFVEEMGLDPRFDQSLVLRGPRRPKAVYCCPVASLDKMLEFVGDRRPEEPTLLVYRIDAEKLCRRNCGPDYGYLIYFDLSPFI